MQPQASQSQAASQAVSASHASSAGGHAGNAPVSPFRLLHNYIFWAYERGSFHYDVMVTLILLFLFVGPRFINFHDRPIPTEPLRDSSVVVRASGMKGNSHRFVYELRAEDLGLPRSKADLDEAVLHAIEPISGAVTLQRVDPVLDTHGKLIAYDAVVLR